MKSEREWAAVVHQMADLITPSGSHWPGAWRTAMATTGQPTATGFFDTPPSLGIIGAALDVGGGLALTDELVRLLVKVGLNSRSWADPAQALDWINRSLLKLPFEPPMISATLFKLDPLTGRGQLARAGAPPALLVIPGEVAQPLIGPAPFLGVADVSFCNLEFTLPPGGRLVLCSCGTVEEFHEVLTHCEYLVGQVFAESVAKELAERQKQPDGVVVQVLDHLAALRLAG